MVDVAGKRNHGEEKEEPNKQFQVYTYYTYRVSAIQNYSHLSLIIGLLLVNLKLQYPHHLETYGHLSLVPGWGGGGEFESCQGGVGNLNHWNTQGI